MTNPETLTDIPMPPSPKKVTKPFLQQKKGWFSGKKESIKALDEPILFLMKENGYTDILEGVKTGEFIISTPKGEKSIWLTPDKLTTIKYADDYFRGWIAYENCMTPYPEDPLYSSELARKITQKIAINYRDINEAAVWTAKTKMWLYIIAAVAIALILLFSTDFGKTLVASVFSKAAPVAEKAVTAVTNTASNTTDIGMR